MIRAGEFEISVGDPYPCWITIKHSGKEIISVLHHKELIDLKYAVSRAIAEVTWKLPDYQKDDMK